MSSRSLVAVPAAADDGVVSAPSSPAGRARRRAFTPAHKLNYLPEYETACETGGGNAYLRGEGLYPSLISEWRRQRDVGLLEGKQPGDAVGRPSREQAEIATLRRQLAKAEQNLATTDMALSIMGKAHALLEQLSESADTDPKRPKR